LRGACVKIHRNCPLPAWFSSSVSQLKWCSPKVVCRRQPLFFIVLNGAWSAARSARSNGLGQQWTRCQSAAILFHQHISWALAERRRQEEEKMIASTGGKTIRVRSILPSPELCCASSRMKLSGKSENLNGVEWKTTHRNREERDVSLVRCTHSQSARTRVLIVFSIPRPLRSRIDRLSDLNRRRLASSACFVVSTKRGKYSILLRTIRFVFTSLRRCYNTGCGSSMEHNRVIDRTVYEIL